MSNEIKLIFILISFCYSQCDSNNDEELDIHDIIITVDCILSDCWSNDIIIDEVAFNDHVYQTVIIGDQTWFAEDLQSYHYANGDEITNLAWNYSHGQHSEGYSDYNGNILYNYHAVEDDRNICPDDWHVSTHEDWMNMLIYLGVDEDAVGNYGYVGTDEGGMLKSMDGWNSPNTGATNSTGFSALPSGNFSYCGMYPPTYCQSNAGYLSQFWTYSGDTAWYIGLDWDRSDIQHQTKDKWAGKSVRCVKD